MDAIGLKEANKDKQHFTVRSSFQGLIEFRNAHGEHAYELVCFAAQASKSSRIRAKEYVSENRPESSLMLMKQSWYHKEQTYARVRGSECICGVSLLTYIHTIACIGPNPTTE